MHKRLLSETFKKSSHPQTNTASTSTYCMCVECPIEYSQRCYQVSFSHVSVQNVGVHIPLVVLPSFFSTM